MKIIFIVVALLSGVALFVVALMIVNGKSFAAKRRKTKLGLVRVAGVGLKLPDEGGPEDLDGQPGVAAADVEPVANVAAVADDTNGIDGGVVTAGNDAVDTNVADAGGAANAPAVAALPDNQADYGKDTASTETLTAPLDGIKSGNDTGAGAQLPPPLLPAIKKTVTGGKPQTYEFRPAVVKKIVDPPIENPFIGGKSPAMGDASAKKTTSILRKRLPETVKMKDRKVILAEDVAINRDLIAMYFDGSGVKFEFAVNGREVCEKFERDPGAYSLILMDIQMPEMNGYEVSRKIRSMDTDWAKQIPIIALTGNDQKEDIDLCFEAGMDDHISKPIDMELLQEKVFDIITLAE
jgi:CheY-like chemotaxis protein